MLIRFGKWRKALVFSVLVCLSVAITVVLLIQNYQQDKIERLNKRSTISNKRPPKGDVSLVLFGDSRAQYWPRNLLPVDKNQVYNAGIAGDLTPNMLWRLEKDVLTQSPQTVVILAGINDIVTASMMGSEARNEAVNNAVENLKAMVVRLQQANCKIVVFTITAPINADIFRKIVWGGDIERDVAKVNLSLLELADENTLIIETLTLFKSLGEGWEQKVSDDALHYSNRGYQVLQESVHNLLTIN